MKTYINTIPLGFDILRAPIATLLIAITSTTFAYAFDEKKALKTFKKCGVCHQIGPDAKNKVGPHLNGLDKRIAGTIKGAKYSNSMKRAGNDGLEWNGNTLSEYLKKPRAFIKGNRMSFAGIKKQDERDNLVAWLLSFDNSGVWKTSTIEPNNSNQLLGASAADLPGDIEFGEYLSGECVTCHQVSGQTDGIPSIVGWPEENFIHAMYEYKTEIRQNPVMKTVAKRLGDEELAALAAYFGAR